MRYDDITAALERADAEEWVQLPELVTEERIERVLGYREDLTVTLVLFDDKSVEDFGEPWVAPYHAPQPRNNLELRDHGLVVVRGYVVDLDGGRWYCPVPRRISDNFWLLTDAEDRLGRMLHGFFSDGDVLDWYGRIAQIVELVEEAGGRFEVGSSE
jgi:hypothetical protein